MTYILCGTLRANVFLVECVFRGRMDKRQVFNRTGVPEDYFRLCPWIESGKKGVL